MIHPHEYFLDGDRHLAETEFLSGKQIAVRSKFSQTDRYDVLLLKDDKTADIIPPGATVKLDRPLHFKLQPKCLREP